jgi:hypothetical protein
MVRYVKIRDCVETVRLRRDFENGKVVDGNLKDYEDSEKCKC